MIVFWDVAPCSLLEVNPTFQRCSLSQSAEQYDDGGSMHL
jgi:hypothetical protein